MLLGRGCEGGCEVDRSTSQKRVCGQLQGLYHGHHRPGVCSPMSIDVTVAEELTIQEHMAIFESNGFKFQVIALVFVHVCAYACIVSCMHIYVFVSICLRQ